MYNIKPRLVLMAFFLVHNFILWFKCIFYRNICAPFFFISSQWFRSVLYQRKLFFLSLNINEMESPFLFHLNELNCRGTTFLNWYRMRVFHIYLFFFFIHCIKVVWKTTCDLANTDQTKKTEYAYNIHIWYAISKSFYYKMVAVIECFCILKFLISRIQSKNCDQNKRIKIERGEWKRIILINTIKKE